MLLKFAFDQGFHAANIITSKQIQGIIDHFQGKYSAFLSQTEKQFAGFFHTPFFSHDPGFTLLMCGLSCYRKEQNQPPDAGPAWGAFAPFARRNYYAEAVQRLKAVVKEIQKHTGITKKQTRIFCNSRAPEKFLGWASGLGEYGKNSLIIHKNLGSLFIIAGLFILLPGGQSDECKIPAPSWSLCGSCRFCLDACPTQAITSPGSIDRALCIQALSTCLIILPDHIKRAFGNRIYGCQTCQEVCPFNQGLRLETQTTKGDVGAWIPLSTLLEMPPLQLKDHLKKTVPGSSWIDMRALKRNALLASGNLKSRTLLPLIKGYLKDPHPALSDAAAWAVKMIGS